MSGMSLASKLHRDHSIIVQVVNCCTHDISKDVNYEIIKHHINLGNLFSSMALEKIECGQGSYDKMTRVCENVKRLSLDGFRKFVGAVAEVNQNTAENIKAQYSRIAKEPLMPTNEHSLNETQPVLCSYNEPPAVSSHSNAASSVTPHSSFSQINQHSVAGFNQVESRYPMSTVPRGFTLIINNKNFKNPADERIGSDEDAERMRDMFIFLGHNVTMEKNLTAKQMRQKLTDFAKHKALHSASALAVVILSHGMENDTLYGVDWQYISKFEIQQIFKIGNCRQMKGKPKLFIFQACRGVFEDKLTQNSSQQLSNDSPSSHVVSNRQDGAAAALNLDRTAETADMCFVHSSSLGYKAYRRQIGSPFIEVLTKCVKELARDTEFLDIMRQVQCELSSITLGDDVMTLPDLTTQLLKKLYLNPPL
ncbi:caspase-3-like [Physella acuta]|uniref:caspase-3-like n=1 Tax=Physella acuta TaxID=109671 RepID=UPI0027DE7A18|nr:caspase-3-like [Physella acuta]